MISNFSYSYILSKHTEGCSQHNRKASNKEVSCTGTECSSRGRARHAGTLSAPIHFLRQMRHGKRRKITGLR